MTYWGSPRELSTQLIAHARVLDTLASVPDRVTQKDIEGAANHLREAAEGMRKLMEGSLTGCTCQRIDNDNYTRIKYDDACVHHRHLAATLADSKKRYENAEKKLTDELRIKLVGHILGGIIVAIGVKPPADEIASAAVALADATIAELAK